MKQIFTLLIISIIFFSCTTESKPERSTEGGKELKETVIQEETYQVKNANFLGIQPLDSLSAHADNLQKGKIRKGNQILDVYNIEINGNELGYLLTDDDNKDLVGKIILQSDKIETEKGLKVGMSFLDLKERYTTIEVVDMKDSNEFLVKAGRYHFKLYRGSVKKQSTLDDAKVQEILIVSN